MEKSLIKKRDGKYLCSKVISNSYSIATIFGTKALLTRPIFAN